MIMLMLHRFTLIYCVGTGSEQVLLFGKQERERELRKRSSSSSSLHVESSPVAYRYRIAIYGNLAERVSLQQIPVPRISEL